MAMVRDSLLPLCCHGVLEAVGRSHSVDAKRNPTYLRAISAAVAEFRDALLIFLELHDVNEYIARGILPAVLPKEGANKEEIARRHSAVARAAGRAAAATDLTGLYIGVQGAGTMDPIAAWSTMTKPKPLLESDDVLTACDQMIGRLDALIVKAEAEAPPTIGTEAMHPLIWVAAGPLWRNGHYRQAVAVAAETLVAQVRARTGRSDVSETAVWQEAFSEKPPTPGKPRLRWPGEAANRDVRTMTDGLRQYAPGVQMTIRNPATHGTTELPEQDALERLAALSLLARWVSNCELVESQSATDE